MQDLLKRIKDNKPKKENLNFPKLKIQKEIIFNQESKQTE